MCPLCASDSPTYFYKDKQRMYLRCPVCHLIFVPPAYFLSPSAEKAEYDLHQNSPMDQGYRRFLSRLFEPMNERIPPQSHGLDFGSGPGPTLSLMFEEAGHTVTIYDKYYAPEVATLGQTYDFITASEVVEHLHTPQIELKQLWSALRPNGTLGIMTKLALDQAAFSRWHYKNDLTHVSFFSRETFAWLGKEWDAEIEFVGSDVTLFRKPPSLSLNEG